MFAQIKVCFKFALAFARRQVEKHVLAYGVIGNTAGFGPVVQGSSPCRPTKLNSVFYLESGVFYF